MGSGVRTFWVQVFPSGASRAAWPAGGLASRGPSAVHAPAGTRDLVPFRIITVSLGPGTRRFLEESSTGSTWTSASSLCTRSHSRRTTVRTAGGGGLRGCGRCRGGRGPVVAEAMMVRGSHASRGPGLADGRRQKKPGSAEANEAGAQQRGSVFARGPRVLFHSASALSPRSTVNVEHRLFSFISTN